MKHYNNEEHIKAAINELERQPKQMSLRFNEFREIDMLAEYKKLLTMTDVQLMNARRRVLADLLPYCYMTLGEKVKIEMELTQKTGYLFSIDDFINDSQNQIN